MGKDLNRDPRIDPRIKAVFGAMNFAVSSEADVASREELLERMNTPAAKLMQEGLTAFLNLCDTEAVAPSAGLTSHTIEVPSEPDGNTINIH